MLAKYKFVNNHPVNGLQSAIEVLFNNIRHVGATDTFDKKIHCPIELRKFVRKNSALESKLIAFFDQYKILGTSKTVVHNCFVRMNEIMHLFDASKRRRSINELPASIHKETKELFKHLYKYSLDSFGDVKDHYRTFYESQDRNICVFCGIERLEHHIDTKEDYDHLLAQSKYPFASVNMYNLAPMCKKCNRTHKKTKDLILLKNSHCKAVNPYFKSLKVNVLFNGTQLPTSSNSKGKWEIDFAPSIEEVQTWNLVFNMSGRIERDFFIGTKEPAFREWIDDFVEDCASRNEYKPYNVTKIRKALKDYSKRKDSHRLRDQRYIKADLFKWISTNAEQRYIRNLIKMINKL